MTPAELTGRAHTHIVPGPAGCGLHGHAAVALAALQGAALADGLVIEPVSGFRDFDRQLSIWNGKFRGERPLLDERGETLDGARLSPDERVSAILLWSALPGASRHHWGTDVDLIDRRAVTPQYHVRLTADEFAPSGPFAALTRWLDERAAYFGFFRPFRGVLSGVRPEPWHLSFAPVAEPARRALDAGVLAAALAGAPLEGKAAVLGRLEELHARYVCAIDWP